MSTLTVPVSATAVETEVYREPAEQFAADLGGRTLRPLAIVIAALNEEEAIGSVLARIPAEVCGQAVDVIVVDDGSTDGTSLVARRHGVLVCNLPYNCGHGVALRLGYLLARKHGADYIATLDADGQYDPAQLPALMAPLVAGSADFVNGSRRLGAAYTTDRVRALGVVFFGALISLLTGQRITDPASGFRAMRPGLTGAVTQRQPQYQTSELLIGAIFAGYTVVEAPVAMYPRAAGETKKGRNVLYGARFFRVVVGTWWRERPGRRALGSKG